MEEGIKSNFLNQLLWKKQFLVYKTCFNNFRSFSVTNVCCTIGISLYSWLISFIFSLFTNVSVGRMQLAQFVN